jgi:hypothetical protein
MLLIDADLDEVASKLEHARRVCYRGPRNRDRRPLNRSRRTEGLEPPSRSVGMIPSARRADGSGPVRQGAAIRSWQGCPDIA